MHIFFKAWNHNMKDSFETYQSQVFDTYAEPVLT